MTSKIKSADLVDSLESSGIVDKKGHTEELNKVFQVEDFQTDWRKADQGGLVCLYKGVTFDPHSKMKELIAKKPALVICEQQSEDLENSEVPFVVVQSGRAAWSLIFSLFEKSTGEKLDLIGVTGTNGKTSTVWFMQKIFDFEGQSCAGLGTLGLYLGKKHVATSHTTPDPNELYAILKSVEKKKFKYMAMEVSSHAIAQKKLFPVKYSAAVFTSFSQDHLDFHKTMEDYFNAKKELFEKYSSPDAYQLIHKTLKKKLSGYDHYYGINENVEVLERTLQQTKLRISIDSESREYTTSIVGDYFCENLTAAIMVYHHFTKQWPTEETIAKIPPVPGRFENVSGSSESQPLPQVIVDYAHTPDAIEKTCEAIKALSDDPLTVLFGCGGDRDPSKRPLMLKSALKASDFVCVTSDNPRTEEPLDIIGDVMDGAKENEIKRIHIEPDRKKAIEHIIAKTPAPCVILIAGKGHEDYQIIGTRKVSFDDRVVAKKCLAKL